MTITEERVQAPPPSPPPAKVSDRLHHERRLGLRLSAPAFIVMILVTAYPLGYAVVLSFYKYRLTDPEGRQFVGLQNYTTVLTDPVWWSAVTTTAIITLVSVVIELVLGFGFAWVMYRIVRGRSFVRTAILVPYGIITVVSAFAWQFAFSLNNGFVNGWLPFVDSDFNWFGQHWSAMTAIMVSEIWKTTPFMALLLLAGLSQVSGDMVEAAQVDGASWWQRLFKVILPNMRAAIMVAVLFRALDAFRIFDNIYVMTRGAQNTESVSFLTYRQVIEQFELGLGSALSVLLFLSVLLIAFVLVKLFRVDLAAARRES